MTMEHEIWKDIPDYEGLYQVSNLGRVRPHKLNPKRNNITILKQSKLWCGGQINSPNGYYLTIGLLKGNKRKTIAVHRLVALAFLPNPDNLLCVNHKDENKTNNCVENLEWCTPEYNNLYGTHHHANKNHPKLSRSINQYKDGVLVNTFPSLAEATRHIGKRNIWAVLQGKKKHCGGYEWRYADIDIQPELKGE